MKIKLDRSQLGDLFLLLLLVLELFTGCNNPSNQSSNNNGKPKVVVTTSVLCDLTKQIAAETTRDKPFDLVCLLTPGSDPHIYKLTPADRQAIADAKPLLYSGYNFEPELIKAIAATSNTVPKIAVNELAVTQPQTFAEDGKSTIDPHVWHNAKNGVKIVEVIKNSLIKIAPNSSALYQLNAQKLTAELEQIDRWIRVQIDTIPPKNRVLVTTHDALGYYSRAYGLPIAALEGLSTEERPNAARVRELIDKIRQTQVPTIFVEATVNPQSIETIARETKVKISPQQLYTDGLGAADSAGNTYQKMLIANTQAIVEGLGGRYSPPTAN
jgi:manganese/iron transport system substrate-binding protein